MITSLTAPKKRVPRLSHRMGLCIMFGTLLSSAMLTSTETQAREPNKLDDIQRETRIVADVMRAALRDQLRGELRLTDVEAQYLARQGVLITVSLNTPWLKISDNGESSFEIHGDIRLPEIPAMVENILHELEIKVAPYEPEALQELRDLRAEQRALRMEGRGIRAQLRDRRRALVRVREEDDDRKEEVQQEIAQLEKQLSVVDQQYDEMTGEIEQHYQHLKEPASNTASAPEPPEPPVLPVVVEDVIANTACDYGGTLKSLSSDEYLTMSVKRGKQTSYFAFRMDHVYQCSNRNMKPSRLLELAYQYES